MGGGGLRGRVRNKYIYIFMEDVETDGEMCEGVENGRKMEEEEIEKEIKVEE